MSIDYDMCEDFKWMVECGIYKYKEHILKEDGWANSEGIRMGYCPFCGNELTLKGCEYSMRKFYDKFFGY